MLNSDDDALLIILWMYIEMKVNHFPITMGLLKTGIGTKLAKKGLQTNLKVADDERRFKVEKMNGLFIHRQ